MGFLARSDEERARRDAMKQARREADEAAERVLADHIARLPKWEYQVKRIGGDKQTGLFGAERMEDILDSAGAEGWELVTIFAERATFKRMLPHG